MIVYVDLEHIRVKKDNPTYWEKHLREMLQKKYMVEALSGEPCLIVRYEKISPDFLQTVKAKAVLVSGNITEFQHFNEAELAGLRAIYRDATRPTLGFCAGAQMMAETFGSRVAAIEEGASGDMNNESWKEQAHEHGFTAVQQLAPHPLLEGLSDVFTMMELHYWEIKSVPEGFVNFARTETTEIQMIAHKSLPLYGTQFHPEEWDKLNRDGAVLLQNFFKLMQ